MTNVTFIVLFSSSYPQAGCNLLVGHYISVVMWEVNRIVKFTMVPVRGGAAAWGTGLQTGSSRGSLELCFDI